MNQLALNRIEGLERVITSHTIWGRLAMQRKPN